MLLHAKDSRHLLVSLTLSLTLSKACQTTCYWYTQQKEVWVKTCRFEALSTQQISVDATSEYVAVIRLRLDKLRIFMAAEVDCYDPSKVKPGHKPDLASYLELKTYM